HAGRVNGEDTRVDGQAGRFLADIRLVARAVVDRGGDLVGAALGDRVDAGAGEVALAHVVGRDADLHLLDRLERDRRDAGAVADAAGGDAEAERVVEVRPVHRHVVRAVVLAGDRAVAAVLRRQPGDVGDAAGNGRQRGELIARDRGGRAGASRAEHRIARADDGDRLRDGGDLETEDEILRHAQADRKIVLRLGREPGNRRRHGVRTTDPHAGHDESSVSLRYRFVGAAGGLVHGGDGRTRDHGTLIVLDDAADGARR